MFHSPGSMSILSYKAKGSFGEKILREGDYSGSPG
jgi:hypothetical protein